MRALLALCAVPLLAMTPACSPTGSAPAVPASAVSAGGAAAENSVAAGTPSAPGSPQPAAAQKPYMTTVFGPPTAVRRDPPAWYSPELFTPMGKPLPGDWMAAHPEADQSVADYFGSRPVRPTVDRHTIILVPLGPMTDADRDRMAVLREFMEIYYTLPVRIGPPAALDGVKFRDQKMYGQNVRQYLSTDILANVLPPLVPKDALCLQAVTMADLYPEESWNYVFGQAMLSSRVGVYSLVRFYPAFWGEKDTPEARRLGLVRSLKVLVHETGHMFGVWHCQTYHCNMNGSNSLAESDRAPIHLCPDCLKKLRWNIGFDVIKRYESLHDFYKTHGMAAEAAWVAARLEQCRAGK